ncbi:MAG: dTDP-4-dehydrorhamnose reductase [Campylobacterota bacterium]|nr:dTDP-4-dehydrorhamnose reductase [Campylobacterota bacterium]
MLGSALMRHFTNQDVIGFGSELNITNSLLLASTLNEIKPNIIIHTAAYTDVDGCETNLDKAYAINTIGTQNLVNYCIDKDVLFVYISSTGIYGTSKTDAYTEFSPINPTTVHHKSKYEGEKVVQNHLQKYLILRTGWLYGGDKTLSKNFVYKRFLEASSKDTVYSDNTQIGNPTYVVDFVKQLQLLIENQQYGIFNCVNNAIGISRYDYVKKIVELFDLNCDVKIAPDEMFKRIAPVSHNESAINYKLHLLDLNIMGDWEKSLATYIRQLRDEA